LIVRVGLRVHNLGYMDKRDVGDPGISQEIFNGTCGLREGMADPDRVPVSPRASFQLMKPVEDGRFATDGVEKDVSPVGRQVQVPSGLESLGMIGCPAVDKEEIIVLDDLQGLMDLPLAFGETRAHMVVHADCARHPGYVFFDNPADSEGVIPFVEGSRTRIEAGVVRLHGLMQHHIMPVITDFDSQIACIGNTRQDGKGDGDIQTEKLSRPGDAVPDIVDNEGYPRSGGYPQAEKGTSPLPFKGKRL